MTVDLEPWLRAQLRCPTCAAELLDRDRALVCRDCGSRHPTHPRLDLRPPHQQRDDDEATRQESLTYEDSIAWLGTAIRADVPATRRQLAERLRPRAGDRVLDLGCGPASTFASLTEDIGPGGHLVGVDRSPTMLALAEQKLSDTSLRTPSTLLLADAEALPFRDASFDAVLHVGFLNQQPDPAAAINEVVRVTKPGGRVLLCDEGLAPWLRATAYGERILKLWRDCDRDPPLDRLPPLACDTQVSWIFGGMFWVVDFTVGTEPTYDPAIMPPLA